MNSFISAALHTLSIIAFAPALYFIIRSAVAHGINDAREEVPSDLEKP